MKKITLLWILLLIPLVYGASDWQQQFTDCPVTYQSQDCPVNEYACGWDTGSSTLYCNAENEVVPPSVNQASNTLWSASYGGGYLVDCLNYNTPSPFCNNDDNLWCNRNSTCYSTEYRDTTCLNDTWGVSTCGDCRSGFNDCDTDFTPCEIMNGASCGSGTGTYYACLTIGSGGTGNCTSATNSDCDNDDGDGDPRTGNAGNYLEIIAGASCGGGTGTYAPSQCVGSTGNCTSSTNFDCNDDDGDGDESTCNGGGGSPDYCEISQGDPCTIGGNSGTYNGCTCVAGNPQHHLTGVQANWTTGNDTANLRTNNNNLYGAIFEGKENNTLRTWIDFDPDTNLTCLTLYGLASNFTFCSNSTLSGGGGSADGNNYSISMDYNSTTGNLTTLRNDGFSFTTSLAGIDTSNNTAEMIKAVNSTGFLIDWNASGYIKNWNASGFIKDWSKYIIDTSNNTAEMIKAVNSTNLLINWSKYISGSSDTIWNYNSSVLENQSGSLGVNTSWFDIRYLDDTSNNTAEMIKAVNSTRFLIDWNASGYIKNWNASGFIKDWSKYIIDTSNNTAEMIKAVNSTNLLINWSKYISGSGDTIWNLNTSTMKNQSSLLGINKTWFDIRYLDDTDTTYTNGTGLNLTGTEFSLMSSYMLPQSCSDGYVAKYNTTSNSWDCVIDWYITGLSISGSGSKTIEINRSDGTALSAVFSDMTGNGTKILNTDGTLDVNYIYSGGTVTYYLNATRRSIQTFKGADIADEDASSGEYWEVDFLGMPSIPVWQPFFDFDFNTYTLNETYGQWRNENWRCEDPDEKTCFYNRYAMGVPTFEEYASTYVNVYVRFRLRSGSAIGACVDSGWDDWTNVTIGYNNAHASSTSVTYPATASMGNWTTLGLYNVSIGTDSAVYGLDGENGRAWVVFEEEKPVFSEIPIAWMTCVDLESIIVEYHNQG